MAEPFPDLTPALGTIMLRIMSASLDSNTPHETLEKMEAVRRSILAAWPDEVAEARLSTVWQSLPHGGSRALYEKR